MAKKVIPHTNPGLARPCRKATEADITLLQDMRKDMVSILNSVKVGIAIAANQAFDNSSGRVPSCFFFAGQLYINPVITINPEANYGLGGEKCLSHQDGHYMLRALELKLDYQILEKGKLVPMSKVFSDFLAIVVQHEVDHLEGRGIWDAGHPYLYM